MIIFTDFYSYENMLKKSDNKLNEVNLLKKKI